MKELMWITGIIDKETNEEIRRICLKENEDLHLSERFFRSDLHISLKRTFYTEQYEKIADDIKEMLRGHKPIDCGYSKLMKVKDMLWLYPDKNDELVRIHNEIDLFLYEKYKIPIDTFDRQYFPHITIFHKGETKNLLKMYDRLQISLERKPITIDRFAIGTKTRGSDFF